MWDEFASFLPNDISAHGVHHLELSDVLEVARELGPPLPEKFAVMGHSFGAHIALALCHLFPERVKELAALVTGSAYTEIPDCTHAIPIEQPRALANITMDWWGSIGS